MRRALSFLTVVGGPAEPSPEALVWFPVVGAAVGLVLGMVWWAAHGLWSPALAASVVLAADLAVTGLLHFDGLVDSADGLLAHHDGRDRRLEVMADPGVGAFGTGVAGATLLLRWAALASLAPSVLLIAGLWCASRTAMALSALAVPYARPRGLASGFLKSDAGDSPAGGESARPPGKSRIDSGYLVGVGLVAATVLGVLGRGWAGGAAVFAALAGFAAVIALARRQVGGFTGDVLGAAGLVGETVGLVVAAGRW